MVLSWKRAGCPLQDGEEALPKVGEFKYLRVLFKSEGKMERESDWCLGAAAAVRWTLNWSVVVKRELLIDQSVYFPILIRIFSFG